MSQSHDLGADVVELAPFVPREKASALREIAFRASTWTPAEVDRLRALFMADEPIDAIAHVLGRRLHGVRSKLFDLGLRRNSSRSWSELEDAELVRRYGGETASRIAQDLGRGPSAVYVRAQLLGLTQPGAPDWDEWELEQLRAGYERGVPVAQIAALIGRPLGGVCTRANKLGLRHPSHPPDWSEAEAARALELAQVGTPYPEIMAALVAEGFPERTKAGFGPKLRKLGYGRGWGRPWTPDEDAILRAAYADGSGLATVAAKTARDRWSVSSRATVLKLSGTHPRPNGFRQGPDWSAEDEAKLRAGYGAKPCRLLAAELGRPLRAVYCHANKLGLKHAWMRAFSEQEDRALAAAWLHQVALTDVARCVVRDVAVVAKRAIRIGVSFSDPRRPEPPRRGVRLPRTRPANLADLLALATPEEIKTRLAELGIELAGTRPRGHASGNYPTTPSKRAA